MSAAAADGFAIDGAMMAQLEDIGADERKHAAAGRVASLNRWRTFSGLMVDRRITPNRYESCLLIYATKLLSTDIVEQKKCSLKLKAIEEPQSKV